MTLTLDRINYLNIALMGISLALAFVLPFEVFMFSYAFLGPLHYLTEISWLHDRKYYSLRKWDWVPLAIISFILLLTTDYFKGIWEAFGMLRTYEFLGDWYPDMMFFAFGMSLLFVVVKKDTHRFIGLVVLALGTLLLHSNGFQDTEGSYSHEGNLYGLHIPSALFKIFGVYLPTLIHVYIFTGLFILYGALKSKSTSGYISFVVYLICPILCFILLPDTSGYHASSWVTENFASGFKALNMHFLDDLAGMPFGQAYFSLYPSDKAIGATDPVFFTPLTIMFMRFVGFAYTYHYLNWFSKTSVIKWHEVPRARFVAVIILWLASAGLYFYNYEVGFRWLFLLSFMHVLLEFPLNHVSFIGIGKEIRMRLGGKPAKA